MRRIGYTRRYSVRTMLTNVGKKNKNIVFVTNEKLFWVFVKRQYNITLLFFLS